MKKDFKAEIAKFVSDSEEMVDADEIESIIETPNDDAKSFFPIITKKILHDSICITGSRQLAFLVFYR